MKCPSCGEPTKVIDTRKEKRTRYCEKCNYRFQTFEVIANSGKMANQIMEYLARYK